MEGIANLIHQKVMTHTADLDLQCKICSNCGTPMEHVITFNGAPRKISVNCKCRAEAYNKKLEDEANQERLRKIEKLKVCSLMDEGVKKCTFENWEHTKESEWLYNIGLKYCENWKKAKEKNQGMLLHGIPGTGKSYLSFCIANYLMDQFVPVIATSSINIINKIYEGYGRNGELGELEIINLIQEASLLILDDLGAEHGGRSGKEKQIIYSIIDARIRAKKPMIITTNLNVQQLKEKLTGSDGVARSFDRIVEACQPLEVMGTSRRIKKASENQRCFKELIS